MKQLLAYVAVIVICLGAALLIGQWLENRCADKGGDFVWTSANGGVCVSTDGRIIP